MDRKLNPLDEKFKKDILKFTPIKNVNLVCRDCKKRYDDTELPCNTSKCEAFKMKPSEIFDGGDCIEYEKEG